jgi:hypothetical protein
MRTAGSPRLEDYDGVVEVTTGPDARPWPVVAVEAFLRTRLDLSPDIHVVGPCSWRGGSDFSKRAAAVLCGITFHGIKPLAKSANTPGDGLVVSYAAFDPQTRALLGASSSDSLSIRFRLLLRRGSDMSAPVVPIEGELAKRLSALVRPKAKAKAKPAKA